jgi:YidC/Oxa1 family membrane protein insertase
MIKRFRLEPRELGGEKTSKNALVDVLTLEVEFVNQGSDSLRLAYQLDGPSGLTDEGWWYSYKVHPRSFGAAGARDIVFRPEGHRHDMILCGAITKYAIENPQSAFKPLVSTDQVPLNLRYIGCDGQYFCTAILPDPGDDAGDPFFQKGGYRFQNALARVVGEPDRKLKKRSNVSFRLVSSLEEIGPGDAVRHRYTVFAGPKHPDALSPYGLDECIVYGWFKIFAKPMVELLHLLHWLSGGFSYGLAILLLTVIVRGAMFPFGRKMALNAQKMQELAPEMKKIADKYKDDMTKRSQAQQELFRKHNYNPLSGCLVMFLQLPVFVGLYRALSVDIQLRQAPLLPGLRWCSNLAGPDMLWHWADILPGALSDPAGWLGPYLNILPVLSTVLMFIQQKLFSPPPTDDQQKMQQQIMKFMMIFMGVLFHKFAAGLCIYFIASSLWGLAERKMLPKSKPVGSLTSVGPPADSSSNGSKAKGGRLRKKGRH